MLNHFLSASCIVDGSLDLAAVADDPRILEETIDISLREASDPIEIELVKHSAEVLPLGEDGAPAQSGLKTLEAQFFKQALIIADWVSPFGVVIVEKLRRSTTPVAAWFSIGS